MNKKIITFSFDDGRTFDVRLVELFNKYNIKCTFNVNAGLVKDHVNNGRWTYLTFDKMKEIYQNHEVASHGYLHLKLTDLTNDEIIEELNKDKEYLSNIFYPKKIQGLAYAYGESNKEIGKIVKSLGFKWARSVTPSFKFDINDYHLYSPTCHIRNNELNDLVDKFLNLKTDKIQILYIWGHSYELEQYNLWEKFEELLNKIANKNDIDYLTNSEAFYRYESENK